MKSLSFLIAAAFCLVPALANAQTGSVNQGAGYVSVPAYDCGQIQASFPSAYTTASQRVSVIQAVNCGYTTFYVVQGQYSAFTVRADNLAFDNYNPQPQPSYPQPSYPQPQPQPYPQPAPGPVYGSPVGHGYPPPVYSTPVVNPSSYPGTVGAGRFVCDAFTGSDDTRLLFRTYDNNMGNAKNTSVSRCTTYTAQAYACQSSAYCKDTVTGTVYNN
jgi:hypothetical protein